MSFDPSAHTVASYPEAVRETLYEAGFASDAMLTPREAFFAWCDYEGLIHYGPKILDILAELELLKGE